MTGTTLPAFFDPASGKWSNERPKDTYNDQRVELHRKLALLDPISWVGMVAVTYPTLKEISNTGEQMDDPSIYTFRGRFWEVFRDVMNIAAQRIHLNNRLKGFWPNNDDAEGSLKLALYPETHGRNVGEVLMLMDSENGEAMESFRKGGLNNPDDKLPHRSGTFTEIVDTMIRAFDFLGGMCADVGTITVEKVAFNTTRPYKHGKTL